VQVHPYDEPWANLYQRQADEALEMATGASRAQLEALRPPLPQIEYLPPRFGYPGYAERQWTLLDVFGINRSPMGGLPPRPRMRGQDRVDYSQSQATTQGSDRNTLGMGQGGSAT
jgi:hypothetical protein